MSAVRLSDDEVRDLAGGLSQPRRQLRELHAQGYWRARLGVDGRVVLERAHYEAVCAGATDPAQSGYTKRDRPSLVPLT